MLFCKSYGKLEQLFHKACSRNGGHISEIARFEGYPIYGIRFGRNHCPHRLLITTGLHGDEPGAVLGLAQWIAEEAARWREGLKFCILPCLNPAGFERRHRISRDGFDLNRQFHRKEMSLVAGMRKWLEEEKFSLAVDLHEDIEFENFYLWEAGASKGWGAEIIEGVKNMVGISHNEQPDGLATKHGIIYRSFDDIDRRVRQGKRGLPMSHFALRNYTDCALTTELPGLLPLRRRISLQVVLLNRISALLSFSRLESIGQASF